MSEININNRVVFDMYFAGIAAMQLHPRNTLPGVQRMTMKECADVVLEMLAVREELIMKGVI